MIGALIAKDLREFRPWALLSVVLGLCDVASELTHQVDMRPLSKTLEDLYQGNSAVLWFTAFAIATGVTTREQDDGTLAFLDGLPVSRAAIFWTKCGVIVPLVMLAPAVSLLTGALLHLLSRGSLDHALRGDLLLQLFALQALLVLNALGLGTLLGRLRSLTWLAVGSAATAIAVLSDRYPRAHTLSPLALVAGFAGEHLAWNMEAVALHVGVGCAALTLAWRGFVNPRPSWLSTLPRRPVIGTLVSALTIAALLPPFVIWARRVAHDGEDHDRDDASAETPRFAPSAPARTVTRHYTFSYPALRAGAALALASDADAVFERVHALLGAELGDVIDVDASGSLRNTEGTAYSGRIRLALRQDARATLAHETAHVVCRRMVGEARAWSWQRVIVLNEGIATWIERQFEASSQPGDELVLAALQARRELLMEEFVDPQLLSLRRDEELKYPVGAALVSAVVASYGPGALQRLVRAFGDVHLPAELQGLPLWQAAFQLAHMDLGVVVDAMYRQVDSDLQRHRDELRALARPRVRLVRKQNEIGAQIMLDPGAADIPEPALRLRFKPTPNSQSEDFDVYPTATAAPIWRDDDEIANGQICVQPGVVIAHRTLYEPWTCLPVRDAIDWPPPAAPASR